MFFFLFSVSCFSYSVCICDYLCDSQCAKTANNNYLVTDFVSDLNLKLRNKFDSTEDEEINLYLYSSTNNFTFSFDSSTFYGNKKINLIKWKSAAQINVELWTEADYLEDEIESATFVLKDTLTLPVSHGTNIQFDKIELNDPSKITVYYEDKFESISEAKDHVSIVANQITIPSDLSQSSLDQYPPFIINQSNGNSIITDFVLNSIQAENALLNLQFNDNKQIKLGSVQLSFDSLATFNCNHQNIDITSLNSTFIASITLMDPLGVNFIGEFPKSGSFYIDGSSTFSITINTTSNIMPISIISPNVELATLKFSKFPSIVTGIITRPVIIDFNSKLTERSTLTFSGQFGSPSIDFRSSYLDIIIANYNPVINRQIKSDGELSSPFIFRTGTGGINTITIQQSAVSEIDWNNIIVYPETNEYINDNELSNLLKNQWEILNAPFNFTSSSIAVTMQNETFIHGFTQRDECMSTQLNSQGITATFTPPSALQLNLCYDSNASQCTEDDGFYVRSMKELSEYFISDFTNLNVNLYKNPDTHLDLNFSFIDESYHDVTLSIRKSESQQEEKIDLDVLYLPNAGLSQLMLENMALPSFAAMSVNFIFFTNCTALTPDVKFSLNEQVNLVFDDDLEEEAMDQHIEKLPLPTSVPTESPTSVPTEPPTSKPIEPPTSEPTTIPTIEPTTIESDTIDVSDDDHNDKSNKTAIFVVVGVIAAVAVTVIIIVIVVIVKKKKNSIKKEDSLTASLITFK